jgi:hypothetical protein
MKMAEEFSVKQEAKLLKLLGDIFTETEERYSEEEAKEMDKICCMDPANVCMVVFKSERARMLGRRFARKDCKLPELVYMDDKPSVSSYSMEYLTAIMKIFNEVDDSVTLKVRNDFPLCVESKSEFKDFMFVLAPRVDND